MLELFKEAGWVAWPLAFCSIIGLAIMLERLFTLNKLRQLEEKAYLMLQIALEKQDDGALADSQISGAPVTQVMSSIVSLRGAHPDAIQHAADIALLQQKLRLRRYLSTLATIGSTAPFIGLFGTVLGVMSAFGAMSKAGLSNEAMAGGISEALSATALGLVVAVPAVIGYNFFLGKVGALFLQIQGHVSRLTPLLHERSANTSSHSSDRGRVKQEA
jgi:biopolymer transport protein ExbB